MAKLFAVILIFGLTIFSVLGWPGAQADPTVEEQGTQLGTVSGIDHVIWIWFENKEDTSITAASAPFFASFAAAGVNFTEFYGHTHPSQPNYIQAFSGASQGVTTNNYCTFPVPANSLPQQLAAAGKSWRLRRYIKFTVSLLENRYENLAAR